MARTTAFQVNNDHHSNTYAAWVSPEQRQMLLELLWELEAIEEAWRERQTTPTDIVAMQTNQVWRDDDRRFSMWDACDREDLSDYEIAHYHAECDSNGEEEIIGVESMASTRPVHRTNQERGRRRQQPKPGRHLRSARNARRDRSVKWRDSGFDQHLLASKRLDDNLENRREMGPGYGVVRNTVETPRTIKVRFGKPDKETGVQETEDVTVIFHEIEETWVKGRKPAGHHTWAEFRYWYSQPKADRRQRLLARSDWTAVHEDDGTPADDLTFAQHDALYWGQKSLSASQVQAEHPAALHKRPRKPRSQRSWVDTDEVVVPQRPRVLYGWVSPRQKSSDYYTLNKGMKRMYGVQV